MTDKVGSLLCADICRYGRVTLLDEDLRLSSGSPSILKKSIWLCFHVTPISLCSAIQLLLSVVSNDPDFENLLKSTVQTARRKEIFWRKETTFFFLDTPGSDR